MNCTRCGGREFLDRVFSDTNSFETSCLHCGIRTFIGKNTPRGKVLAILETKMNRIQNGLV